MDRMRLFVYGDHLGDKVKGLRKAQAIAKSRPAVKDFLHRTTDRLRALCGDLTPTERAALGDFDDLQDLAATLETSSTSHSEAASFALTVTAQVAELLRHCLEDSTVLAPHGAAETEHFGVCLGLLTACLAATACSIEELSRLGVELVAVAFRLGLACSRRSQYVEASDESWARTFVGTGPDLLEKSVKAVNENAPPFLHASLGVITSEWVTVFGPPGTLARLENLPDLRAATIHTPKASSCVHAPHLAPVDIEYVLGADQSLDAACARISTVSPFPDDLANLETLRQALAITISEIANGQLYLEECVQSLTARFQGHAEADVVSVGLSTHLGLIKRQLQAALPEIAISEPGSPSPAQHEDVEDSIAVVGMSGRFPQAENLAQFWSLLEAGLAVHEEIPASRFAIGDFHDPMGDGKNSTGTRFGCFLKNPGLFDNWFFNISPKEAMQLDPLQRMLLMSTYEALQQAGYAAGTTPSTQASRIATFFGQTTGDWNTINEQQGIDVHYIPGTNRAFTPGRLNHFFQWGGGYYSVDTACSASSTSMHLASNALLAKECDTAVVGGGQLCVLPEMFAGLSKGGFLSSTGGCKTFADDADGYCRGEAVGVVVLKRLSDAMRENDNVLAVVRGTARNTNGVHGSIVSPHQPAQEALFRKVLSQSNVLAQDVDYVEMHGTGTQAGDTAEMESVMNIFSRPSGRTLHVGAVKANVGHSEAAAGIVALIKTILMLQKGSIPPQPCQPLTLNRYFRSLEQANVVIPKSVLPWTASEGRKRLALINGFDAAGGNTSILLEEGKVAAAVTPDPRTHHVVAFSGHTWPAVQANKQRLLAYLQAHPHTQLCDIAYTTTARRVHEKHRQAYAVDSIDNLIGALSASNTRESEIKKPSANRVAFLFTGQSSQYTGMGSTLYQTSPQFRGLVDSYQAICSGMGLPRFLEILRGLLDLSIASAPQQQLSIVALEIALAEYWRGLGLEPDVVMGHSLGEYAALVTAGVLSVSSALYLVHKRAELMEAKCSGTKYGMLAVSLSEEEVQQDVRQNPRIEVACLNGPSATVLSGEAEELATVETTMKSKGVNAVQLKVQFGFHSQQMEPILEEFKAIASKVHFASPRIPVASTCTGETVREAGVFDAAYLCRQTREPVQYVAAARACEAEGLIDDKTFALEIGPHPVCIGLLTACLSSGSPMSFASLQRGRDDWQVVSSTLAAAYSANVSINWADFHKEFKGSLQLLDLPTYAWDLTNFWAPYQTQRETASAAPVAAPISPSVQSVESLRQDDGRLTGVFVSHTSEPVLYQAIQGHAVSGVAICPASVFMDMAYTTARFLFDKAGSGVELTQMQLQDLKMTQALLVPRKNPTQVIRITAMLETATKTVDVRFQSVDGSTASGIDDHGHATVVAGGDKASQRNWSQMRRLVQGRTDALADSPQAHRMTTPLIYKLFASMVDYSKPYQALQEAHVDESFQDAMATIALESAAVAEVGNFTYSPFILDALVHLVGFLLNADLNKTDDDLHMANSIGGLHIMQPLRADHRKCVVYASIRERDVRTGVSLCDVFVFDQSTGDAVAICNDIRFQQLPPEVFSSLVLRKSEPTKPAAREPVWTPDTTPADSSSRSSSRPAKRPSIKRSEVLLRLTADELGVDVNSFKPDTEFEDLGLHSMATLKIMAAFRRETGVELPVAMFADNGTVGRMKAALDDVLEEETSDDGEAEEVPAQPSPAPAPTPSPLQRKRTEPIANAEMVASAPPPTSQPQPTLPPPKPNTPIPEARVVLVQGDRHSPLPPVFLATAGIGLAAPYIRFPRLAGGRPIYALESPFVECPDVHTHSAVHLAEIWIKCIRKIRNKGPYIVGGYSGGGAWAYEMARQLAVSGSYVSGLLIIDCRVPSPVPTARDIIAIPVNATGLTEKNKVHMIASARTLVRYDPQQVPSGMEPGRTHLIWCEGGESDGGYGRAAMHRIGEGRDSRTMAFQEYQDELNRWFCGKREPEDFDTNDWEDLVGGRERMRVHSVPGNHSSMMRPPHVARVGELLVEFVEDLAEVEREMMAKG